MFLAFPNQCGSTSEGFLRYSYCKDGCLIEARASVCGSFAAIYSVRSHLEIFEAHLNLVGRRGCFGTAPSLRRVRNFLTTGMKRGFIKVIRHCKCIYNILVYTVQVWYNMVYYSVASITLSNLKS